MKTFDGMETARQALLLRSLPEGLVDKVLADASIRRCSRGETIFLQDEEARVIHVVLDGWVKLYRVAPSGNEAVVSVFEKGRSFGEAVAFRRARYPVSAETVTDCRLLVISARSLILLIEREPEVALAVISSTFQHLHDLVGQIEQMKARTGAQRVADFLIRLCDCAEGACTVTLPYDKALIAARLGMKPESLSRAFSKLRMLGVQVGRHHARIADIGALEDFISRDPAEAWGKAL